MNSMEINSGQMNTISAGGDEWIHELVGREKGEHYIYPDEFDFEKT